MLFFLVVVWGYHLLINITWSQTLWCPSGSLLGEISVEVTVFMLSCAWLCLVLPLMHKTKLPVFVMAH